MRHRSFLLAPLLFAFLPLTDAGAQSLWGVDGFGGTAFNVAGPPAGPCGYPTGPVIGGFPYVGGICATPGPFAGGAVPPVGDITVDRSNDMVWVTDGFLVSGYSRAGAHLATFPNPLPMPLTGLGYGGPFAAAAGPGILWLTDGTFAAAVVAPLAGCVPAPPFLVAPFFVAFAGLATDIDFDPATGTLFLSNLSGVVSNELVGGGLGPFGVIVPAAGCLPSPLLNGIAVDVAMCRNLYVQAGGIVIRIDFTGAPSVPTFYSPFSCFPWAGGAGTAGLAFDAAPIPYAASCDPGGAPGPIAGFAGQAVSPNPTFTLTLSGAAPGGLALLVLGTGAACPALPLPGGCGLAVAPISGLVGPFPVPAAGSLSLPAAIPPGLACTGAQGFLQWLVKKPAAAGGGFQTSQALELTAAMP